MLVLAIILLIVFGIALLIAEFFILPGITVAGVGGFVLTAVGVFLTYKSYGALAGNVILVVSIILFVLTFWFSLKSKTWKKLALNSELEGRVNTIEGHKIHEGDRGVAVSRLAPMGRVRVNNMFIEAKSSTGYVDENTEVEIIKVNESNVLVKPLK
jgi:membrane-bound ClpP family serine protease